MKFNRAESLADFTKQTRREQRTEREEPPQTEKAEDMPLKYFKVLDKLGQFDWDYYEEHIPVEDEYLNEQGELVTYTKKYFTVTNRKAAKEFIKEIPNEFLNDSKFWFYLLRQDDLIWHFSDFDDPKKALNEFYKYIPEEVKSSREGLRALAEIFSISTIYGVDDLLAIYRKMEPAEREKRLVANGKDYPAATEVTRRLLALEK